MTRYTIATRNETRTTLTEEAIEAFRQRLRGPLLTSVLRPRPGRHEELDALWIHTKVVVRR
jgi:hypothetical protein